MPATLSPLVLQDLLRSQMSFDGLIATDSLGMGALSNVYGESEAAALALQAGADLLMFGNDPGHTPAEARAAYAHVLNLVQSGAISLDRVEASLRRVLALKARYGLLTWQPVDQQAAPLLCGTAESRSAALHVALDSVTLLTNDGVLPLSADAPVLLVVPGTVVGLDSALRAYLPALDVLTINLNPTAEQIATAVARATNVDAVVVATWDATWHAGQVSLVQELAGHPLVVAALNTPHDLTPLQAAGVTPSAYLCTYSDVPSSLEALAMVLSGAKSPRGRLPVPVGDAYPIGYGWESYDER
jgi:beta-N-acetylhexosaminidase